MACNDFFDNQLRDIAAHASGHIRRQNRIARRLDEQGWLVDCARLETQVLLIVDPAVAIPIDSSMETIVHILINVIVHLVVR